MLRGGAVGAGDTIGSLAEFTAAYTPPEFIIRALGFQRGQLVTLTAQPGGGKTALALEWSIRLGAGLDIGGEETAKQRVLFFAGENADDTRLRILLTLGQLGLKPSGVDLDVIDGSFALDTDAAKRISGEVSRRGAEYALVVIDTSAAYFYGEDENSNSEMHGYYQVLRSITRVGGNPMVLVLAHPAKSAREDDALVPRGGSSIYATVDGNMTATSEGNLVKVSVPAKWRGPKPKPSHWRMASVVDPAFIDTDGRVVPSVRAIEVSPSEVRVMADTRGFAVLASFQSQPNLNQQERAEVLGLSKTNANRAISELFQSGDLEKSGRQHAISPSGKQKLKTAKDENA